MHVLKALDKEKHTFGLQHEQEIGLSWPFVGGKHARRSVTETTQVTKGHISHASPRIRRVSVTHREPRLLPTPWPPLIHFLIPSFVFRHHWSWKMRIRKHRIRRVMLSLKTTRKFGKNSSERVLLKMMHEKILHRVGGRFERRAERFSVRVCTRRPRLRQAICPRQAPARVLDAGHAISGKSSWLTLCGAPRPCSRHPDFFRAAFPDYIL